MAKVVKEYDERKTELLNTAQGLFYSKGYENTSVADIIEAVGIAKGTFYHYFKAKDDLLNQLIERISDAILIQLETIVNDTTLNAIDKFNKFYIDAGNYKMEHKEAIIVISRVFYREENLKLREKLMKTVIKKSAPQLTKIIQQGVAENVFTTSYSSHLAELIFTMGIYLRDEFATVIVKESIEQSDIDDIVEKSMMYQEAIERLLGAPQGSIKFLTRELIEYFFK